MYAILALVFLLYSWNGPDQRSEAQRDDEFVQWFSDAGDEHRH